MAYADDLLEQAHHLATREKLKPRQASLRRAVSTAYYSLFHLLVEEAVSNWKRVDQRADLARVFEHNRMKAASGRVLNSSFPGVDPCVVAELHKVAGAFSELQQRRHVADYDNSTVWTRTQALRQVENAAIAFQSWRAVRKEEIAQRYLLSLFVKDRQ